MGNEQEMWRLDEDLRARRFKPVYLLCGEERYLRNEYRDKLIEALVGGKDSLNLNIFTGKDLQVPTLIDLAETVPFFADHRLIIVENSEFFKTKRGKSKAGENLDGNDAAEEMSQENEASHGEPDENSKVGEQNARQLADYLPTMPKETVILFVEDVTDDKLDQRMKLVKTIKTLGRMVNFGRKDDVFLKNRIDEKLGKEHKGIDPSAADQLLRLTGGDMTAIMSELEKLISYTGKRGNITIKDVDEICTVRTEDKVFAMIDAISVQNQKWALDLYYDLLALRVPSMKILVLLARQFNRILQAADLRRKGFGVEEIATRLQVKPFVARITLQQSGNFSMQTLRDAVVDCARINESIVKGNLIDQIGVEMLIVKYSQKKDLSA